MSNQCVGSLRNLALVLAAGCLFASGASADDSKCPSSTASTQDVEGGATLNAATHKAGAAKRFELMDANGDGKVTAAEIGGSRGAESIAWASKLTSSAEKIAQLDTNRDGALTLKEYADSSQSMFNKLDVDADGVLSESEMLMPSAASNR